jgi:SAM-dependent methyltransferase
MNCTVCKHSQWEKVDQFRIKPQGMHMCTNCGFITYPDKYKSKDQVFEYYRTVYRGTPPKVHNLLTGQNKLHMHTHFLKDIVHQWLDEGKKDPVICDVGAAYGLFLAWWRDIRDEKGQPAFPDAHLFGTELTKSFRRVAYHEFGLTLNEDFDDSKQYDLITSFKVAEHIYGIEDELVRYKKALKPGGKLYISVPTWFNRLHNFGAPGFDIEYYYHPDHCNVWTRGHFEKVLTDAGFKITFSDQTVYDSTYICEVGEGTPLHALPTPKEIRECLERVFRATHHCLKREFDAAIEVWPNLPVARRAAYEMKRAALHKKGYKGIREEVIDPWLAIDPEYLDALLFAGELALRYNQFDDAEAFCKRALHNRPLNEGSLTVLANVYRSKAHHSKNPQEKTQAILNARECAKIIKNNFLAGFQNSVTWIYNDHAQLPMPGE